MRDGPQYVRKLSLPATTCLVGEGVRAEWDACLYVYFVLCAWNKNIQLQLNIS